MFRTIYIACLVASMALGASAENRLPRPVQAAFSFPFTNPDTGKEYRLSMEGVYYQGIPLRFLEHVFDYEKNRQTLDLIATDEGSHKGIFTSNDLGKSWRYAGMSDSILSTLFTTSSGTWLAWDIVQKRLMRIGANWHSAPVEGSPEYPWLGSQSIGQHGQTIMLAEYWTDIQRREGHVYRSRDDGRSWERVFTMPALGSELPDDKRITHFHTVQPDPYYPGHWYLSSGDTQGGSRVWLTTNDGDQWVDVTDPKPQGVKQQSIHRYTSILFTPDNLIWATDDRIDQQGTRFVLARRGVPLSVRAVSPLTENQVRSIVSTDLGTLILTENSRGFPLPVVNKEGIEIGLYTNGGQYRCVGALLGVKGVFTSSLASRDAIDGVFFSRVMGEMPERMLRWQLSSAPLDRQSLIEGGAPLTIDLPAAFHCEQGTQRVFAFANEPKGIADVLLNGNQLVITPVRRGETRIHIQTTDSTTPSLDAEFGLIVYPKAYTLTEGPYEFTRWSSDESEGSFPEHILFLETKVKEPGPKAPLPFVYAIPHETYSADEQSNVGFPYRASRQSRVNGLGGQGISFVNAENDTRSIGGLLLALNTEKATDCDVSWVAGLKEIAPRNYRLRLQYRLGTEGDFQDVTVNGMPVEYVPEGTPDARTIGPVTLPPDVRNKPYVQLLWRYCYMDGDTGASPELQLANIHVRETLKAAIHGSKTLHATTGRPFSMTLDVHGQQGNAVYRWYHSRDNQTYNPIPGANAASYAIAKVNKDDLGWYKCQVTDASATVDSPSTELVSGLRGTPAIRLAACISLAAVGLAGLWVLRQRRSA